MVKMDGTLEIFKDFRFEAAHTFPNVPIGHPCKKMHGHSFRFRVFVTGEIGQETGWVIDFAEIKRACAPLLEILDHSYLNEIPGLENPTSEILALWIWKHLEGKLRGLSGVLVRETGTSGAMYRGRPRGMRGEDR
jgi:6-pyruvoyltetrahydropterin/6-carboxytetrahydropterin synthase